MKRDKEFLDQQDILAFQKREVEGSLRAVNRALQARTAQPAQ